MMKIFKGEKGIAMPLVLIIMLVLGLLGTALWNYSLSELNQSVSEEKRARAYYLARAGAESLARHITVNPSIIDLVPNEGDMVEFVDIDYMPDNHDLSVGDIKVNLERVGLNSIKVNSTGIVNGTTKNVSILLEKSEFDVGNVYSLNTLHFKNNVSVDGDIVTGGKLFWGNSEVTSGTHQKVNGTITTDIPIDFTPEPFPDSTVSSEDPEWVITSNNPPNEIFGSANEAYRLINLDGNNVLLTIDGTTEPVFVETDEFKMHQHANLHLKTSSVYDMTIVVDTMELTGLKISGDGIVKLYVRSNLNMKTPHARIDIADTANLLVYLDEGSELEIHANSSFTGLVYGPEAYVRLQSAQSIFEGSMIVKQMLGGKGDSDIGPGVVKGKYIWGDLLDEYYSGGFFMVHWVE